MSDKEFEELFEKAPDWPAAVAALRDITAKTEDSGSALALLKDTAAETILSLMSCHLVTVKSASMNRYTGGELAFEAPPWHTFVLKKAFFCYRSELVPSELTESVRVAREEEKAAGERRWEFERRMPPEMRHR